MFSPSNSAHEVSLLRLPFKRLVSELRQPKRSETKLCVSHVCVECKSYHGGKSCLVKDKNDAEIPSTLKFKVAHCNLPHSFSLFFFLDQGLNYTSCFYWSRSVSSASSLAGWGFAESLTQTESSIFSRSLLGILNKGYSIAVSVYCSKRLTENYLPRVMFTTILYFSNFTIFGEKDFRVRSLIFLYVITKVIVLLYVNTLAYFKAFRIVIALCNLASDVSW